MANWSQSTNADPPGQSPGQDGIQVARHGGTAVWHGSVNFDGGHQAGKTRRKQIEVISEGRWSNTEGRVERWKGSGRQQAQGKWGLRFISREQWDSRPVWIPKPLAFGRTGLGWPGLAWLGLILVLGVSWVRCWSPPHSTVESPQPSALSSSSFSSRFDWQRIVLGTQ